MDDSTATTPSPSTATATAAGYEAARDKQQTKNNNNIGNSNVAASAAAAAAAANSKSVSSVRLLIKSSNQQYDDMNIESDLCWTVERLKKQLSLVYPGKPVGALTNIHTCIYIHTHKPAYINQHKLCIHWRQSSLFSWGVSYQSFCSIFSLFCRSLYLPRARDTSPSFAIAS